VDIKRSAKKAVKTVISPVVIKNSEGLKEAVFSYYPEYLFGNGAVKTLKHVSIEVTFRCNCRCKMCPLYGVQVDGGKELIASIKEEEELNLVEFEDLFRDLKELGTRSVNFTGGEAFLRKDMLEITRLARGSGLEVSFTSNMGTVTKEIARELVNLGVNNITISLDGPKDVHEDIRKTKIFDRIMAAVDWIEEEKEKQKRSKPSLGFLCTVSALNQRHLVKLVEIANKKSLPLTIDPIIFTTQDDWENTKKALQEGFIKKESFTMPDEIGKIDTNALEEELERVFDEARKLDQPVYVSVGGRKTRERFFTNPNYSVVNKCFAPWYSCRIDPYGDVYPCSLSIQMGNLREKSFKEIINGEKFVNFRKKLKKQVLFPSCKKCCVLYSHNAFWNYLPRI
jgi:radical SAM protein with 4Fe4S-binding SPASM domain